MKWLIFRLMIALLATSAALLGCAPSATAYVTISATPLNEAIVVAGETDPPDGALLSVGAIMPDSVDPFLPGGGPRTVTVESGRYEASFDAQNWPAGRIHLSVGLSVWEDQPQVVVDRFGPAGERLQGPRVHQDSDGSRILTASTQLTLDQRSPEN